MPEGCSALSECYRICQTRADYAVRCSFFINTDDEGICVTGVTRQCAKALTV
jgi:hypothetical protein